MYCERYRQCTVSGTDSVVSGIDSVLWAVVTVYCGRYRQCTVSGIDSVL